MKPVSPPHEIAVQAKFFYPGGGERGVSFPSKNNGEEAGLRAR